MERAAVGFTVKSGWAATVLVRLDARGSPRVADSRRIELSDPDVPDSRQPYHAGFGTARDRGSDLTRLVASVRQFGRRSVSTLLKRHATEHSVAGAGIVVGSLGDPSKIASDHIRIHALEGQLFRTVVEESARRSGVRCEIWRERDLYAAAAEALGQSEQKIRATVTALGRDVEGPWRAEQKAAATAAWIIAGASPRGLRRRPPSTRDPSTR